MVKPFQTYLVNGSAFAHFPQNGMIFGRVVSKTWFPIMYFSHFRLFFLSFCLIHETAGRCYGNKFISSIGRFLEPPFRSQEPFPLPPAILDDVTSVSGSGNGSWLLNGGSKNLPVFRLSGHMYIGMSPLAQVDQIPWPGDRQTVECGQHLGTWWRVYHFFFLTVLCNSLELLHSTVS